MQYLKKFHFLLIKVYGITIIHCWSLTMCMFLQHIAHLHKLKSYFIIILTEVFFIVFLDATKAFDKVNYCKLFRKLLHRNMSPLVLRLLLYMYTNQSLREKWGNHFSDKCNA